MQIDTLTPTMERILKMAEIEAQKNKSPVGAYHVLIGMMLEGSNFACLMLQDAGFTVEAIRNGESASNAASLPSPPKGV